MTRKYQRVKVRAAFGSKLGPQLNLELCRPLDEKESFDLANVIARMLSKHKRILSCLKNK